MERVSPVESGAIMVSLAPKLRKLSSSQPREPSTGAISMILSLRLAREGRSSLFLAAMSRG